MTTGLVAVAGLATVLIGAAMVSRPGPEVPVLEVRSAPFRARVTADGNLAAVRSTPLTAPLKPQMPFTLAWLVKDGALVQAGDVIARFDPSQLERDREDGLSDQRISGHRIESAEVEREVNVGKLDRDAEIAARELEVARDFQTTDTLIYSKQEITESQIDTELAETRAEHARVSQEIVDRLSETDIELLTIERRKADIKVQQAAQGLDSLELESPHGGIVMLERDWRGNPVRVGDTVWPGRTLARIPDLTEMQAEVFVLEADAGGLEVGQLAAVWIEARPKMMYSATLQSLDPMAGRRNRRSPVQYFRAVLALDHTDRETMKPGARVHAEITIADLESAITVPRQAVSTVDGQPVVYRWRRGDFVAARVELGPSAFGRVVVTAGLEEGDLVALRNPTTGVPAANRGERRSMPLIPGGGS